MKISFTDFLLLLVLALFGWFFLIEPRIDQPQPPIITAGPIQPTPYPTFPAGVNVPATQFVQTWEAYDQQFEPVIAVVEPQGTQTPGPTINEYTGNQPGGNLFTGDVVLP